jgi:dinuclear metal center YbgI/SA1388 family protein
MNQVTATQIVAAIEELAPLHYQESYDNAGFCIGHPQTNIKGVLLCLDVTEDILDEALQVGANLIISHHPVIFKGLKRITGKSCTERIVEKAIKHNLVLYAAHTNIDSVRGGVSEIMANKLQLQHTQILSPKRNEWLKIVTFVPHAQADTVRTALCSAGAGKLGNYSRCSWNTTGEGTFLPQEGAAPFVGEPGQVHTEPETRIEAIFPRACLARVIRQLQHAHPYEEPAYDILPLENTFAEAGLGMIGNLPEPVAFRDFLQHLKTLFQVPFIRYSQPPAEKLTRIAVCGGSGAFLLQEAIASGATALVSADFKYHDFFDADKRLMIADVGHYESEKDVLTLFHDCLTKKLSNFAVHLTKNTTNAINYF